MRLLLSILTLLPALVFASGGANLMHANNDLHDNESLQRGAKIFVDSCLGCHSASYMRYSRMGKDLQLDETTLLSDYMHNIDKVGSPMFASIDNDSAETFFGVVPPDLSVVSRSRGIDWLYTYFLSFYVDDSKATGVNNLVFKDVGMPHVLWQDQGLQKAVYKTEMDKNGHEHQVFERFEAVNEKGLTEEELAKKATAYENKVRDLVNFLEYMGEPVKTYRQSLGIKVLIFLLIFFVFALLLKKEYWKDIH